MDVKEIRRRRLAQLLAEPGQKQVALAQAIGRKPPQISQWLSGYREMSEDLARLIETKMRRPLGWMDRLDEATLPTYPASPPPTLHQALEVLGSYLAQPMPPEQVEDVAHHLALLAKRNGSERDQALVEQLLHPANLRAKPRRTGTE